MFDMTRTYVMPLVVGGNLIGRILWEQHGNKLNFKNQLKELEAFSTAVGLALSQKLRQEDQKTMCEQLTQNSRLLSETQTKLVNKRSMASVGEMACGAAHEINNPLAVIVGRAQLLAASEEDTKRKDTLEAIANSGQTITGIISELLAFAVPDKPMPKAVTIKKVIDKSISLLDRDLKKNQIEVECAFDAMLPKLFVDDKQISSAISEVISNAMNAYDGVSGKIKVTGFHDELNDEVIIEIEDSGCGMTNEIQDKAFMPFYSGKEAGRNRGLGLSRSLRNIEANEGHVKIESESGEGTRVRVFLPIVNVNNEQVVSV